MTKRIISSKRGFTLMEVLIVVAIIAILITVSIPVFTSQLEKTRSATCATNRRSLKGVLTYSYMLEALSVEDINKITLNSENGYLYDGEAYKCPSGGTLSAVCENGSVSVSCSYHGAEQGSTSTPVWTNDSAKKLWEIIIMHQTGINSTAVNGDKKEALLKDLKENGIDLKKMGAESWSYNNDGYGAYFEWTTADISTMDVGDTVIVMRYRLEGTYEGIYSVWNLIVEANGAEKKITTKGSEYTGDLSDDIKKDIKNVMPYYNDNAKTEGLPILN